MSNFPSSPRESGIDLNLNQESDHSQRLTGFFSDTVSEVSGVVTLDECKNDISLADWIVSYYQEAIEHGDTNFYCNQSKHQACSPLRYHFDLTLLEVELTPGRGIKWSYSPEECAGQFSDVASIKSLPLIKEVDFLNASKIRHELICSAFTSDQTDKSLGGCFPTFEWDTPGFSALSPDVVYFRSGIHHFIEVTSTTSMSEQVIDNKLREKMQKYSPALMQVNQPVSLTIIVVSPNMITSNIPIPVHLVNYCQLLFRLGMAIEMKSEQMGHPLNISEESVHDYYIPGIKAHLSEIKFSSRITDPLHITEDFINKTIDPHNLDFDLIEGYVHSTIMKTYDEGLRLLTNNPKSEQLKKADDYLNKCETGQGTRNVMKPCTNMPLVYLKRDGLPDTRIKTHILETNKNTLTTLSKCWNYSFLHYNDPGTSLIEMIDNLLQEAYCDDITLLHEMETERRSKMKVSHRVDLLKHLTDADKMVLMKDGVWAKKHDGSFVKQMREAEQKTPLDFNVDTTDIDEWLKNNKFYQPCDSRVPASVDLLRHNLMSTGQDEKIFKKFESILSLKMFHAYEFISDISNELSISINQNTKRGEVIIKKLVHYNAYMLVIPTKSSSHIFFSLFIPKQESFEIIQSLPFRQLHELDDGSYVSDFVSFRSDKMENQSTPSSMFVAMFSFWAQFYNDAFINVEKLSQNSEFIAMMNMSMLIRLEDKAHTEEVITLSRYMYMEVEKQNTIFPADPFKMIPKFPKFFRSRLQIWFTKSIIKYFKTMIINPPERLLDDHEEDLELADDEEVRSYDNWKGLLNFVTGKQVRSASKLVNLFYLGYLKDKNEVAQENSDFKLVEKTITEELKYDKSSSSKSNGDSDDFNEEEPTSKQYSWNFVKMGCQITLNKLRELHGSNYFDYISDNILKALANHVSESLATFKASSPIHHKDLESMQSIDHDLTKRTSRIKCIEAVVQELDLFKTNPFLSLNSFIECIENSTVGVVSDLFKKNQHAGLREIYVLTIQSRVIALFLETISRVICSELENETMTHPNNKTRLVDAHRMRNSHKKIHNPGVEQDDFMSSMDKSKWNNEFVMTVLSMPLFTLTPPMYHPAIQRCLNMWVNRLIELPASICNLLQSNTTLHSEVYIKLLNDFNSANCGDDDSLFIRKKSRFLKFKTGMMQGILHYTSSLLHVVFLNTTQAILETNIAKVSKDHSIDITQMCSSDDSGMLVTLTHPTPSDFEAPDAAIRYNHMMTIYCQLLIYSVPKIARFFCMEDSVKSTHGSRDVYEFNSEFIITNTMAVATLKMVNACLSCTESESLTQRMSTFYNLMSAAASANFPSINTFLVQLAQGLFHYKLMGCGTSVLFDEYVTMIRKFPSPLYGYFILDDQLICGTLGFPYNYWNHCRSHPFLFRIPKKEYTRNSLQITEDGGVQEMFVLKHGDSRRQAQMVEGMSGGSSIEDIRNEVEENFHLLYSDSIDKNDVLMKIKAKAISPGASISLSRGVPFMQALASSVYGIGTHCWQKIMRMPDGTKKKTKTSILLELRHQVSNLVFNDYRDTYLEEGLSEKLMFPNCEIFRDYQRVLNEISTWVPIRKKTLRSRKTLISIPHYCNLPDVSLLNLVKHFWFAKGTKQSRTSLEHYWNLYCERFPWLDKNADVTLKQSPFESHVEMHSFFSSENRSSRTFMKIGPSIRTSNPLAQIVLIAKRCSYLNHVLMPPLNKIQPLASLRPLRCKLSLALMIPNKKVREDSVNIALGSEILSEKVIVSMDHKNRKDSQLIIFQMVAQKRDPTDIIKAISEMGFGLMFSYIKPQRLEEIRPTIGAPFWKYVGPGTLQLSSVDFIVRIQVMDDSVLNFTTNNIMKLKEYKPQIDRFLNHLKMNLKITRQNSWRYSPKDVMQGGLGTPVSLDLDLIVPFASDMQFSIRTSINKMDLLQTKKESDLDRRSRWLSRKGPCAEHIVFSHNVRAGDIMPMDNDKEYNTFWDAFIFQGRLEFSASVAVVLATMSSDVDHNDQEVINVKNLLANTLRDKLVSRWLWSTPEAILTTNVQIMARSSTIFGDIINTDLASYVDIGHKASKVLGLESLLERPTAFDKMDQDSLLDLFSEQAQGVFNSSMFSYRDTNMDICMDRLRLVTAQIPLWDPLIDGMRKDNHNYWSLLLSKGKVHKLNNLIHIALLKLIRPDFKLELTEVEEPRITDSNVNMMSKQLFPESSMYEMPFKKTNEEVISIKDGGERISQTQLIKKKKEKSKRESPPSELSWRRRTPKHQSQSSESLTGSLKRYSREPNLALKDALEILTKQPGISEETLKAVMEQLTQRSKIISSEEESSEGKSNSSFNDDEQKANSSRRSSGAFLDDSMNDGDSKDQPLIILVPKEVVSSPPPNIVQEEPNTEGTVIENESQKDLTKIEPELASTDIPKQISVLVDETGFTATEKRSLVTQECDNESGIEKYIKEYDLPTKQHTLVPEVTVDELIQYSMRGYSKCKLHSLIENDPRGFVISVLQERINPLNSYEKMLGNEEDVIDQCCNPMPAEDLAPRLTEPGRLYEDNDMDQMMDRLKMFCKRGENWPLLESLMYDTYDNKKLEKGLLTPVVCFKTTVYKKMVDKKEIELQENLKRGKRELILELEHLELILNDNEEIKARKAEIRRRLETLVEVDEDLSYGYRSKTMAELAGATTGHWTGYIQHPNDRNVLLKVDGCQNAYVSQSEYRTLKKVFGKSLNRKTIKLIPFPSQTESDCGAFVCYSLISICLGLEMWPLTGPDLRTWCEQFYDTPTIMENQDFYLNIRPKQDLIHSILLLDNKILELTAKAENHIDFLYRSHSLISKVPPQTLKWYNMYVDPKILNHTYCLHQEEILGDKF